MSSNGAGKGLLYDCLSRFQSPRRATAMLRFTIGKIALLTGKPLPDQNATNPHITLLPTQRADLLEVCTFLHQHLNPRLRVEQWLLALDPPWMAEAGNHGFHLRMAHQVVGAMGAIYSRQSMGGQEQDFCNLTSWCVLPAYRRHGIALLGAVLGQPGYHFTNFTASLELLSLFRMLGFREMAPGVYYWFNGAFPPWRRGGEVLTDAQNQLPPWEQKIFHHHRPFPGLAFCWFGPAGEQSMVVYRPRRRWGMAAAQILHLTRPANFLRHFSQLRRHLWQQGFPLGWVAQRQLPHPPPWSFTGRDTQPRLYRSREIQESEISPLYSELITFDL